MAQQLRNLALRSPGFGGINTEDSPLEGAETFADTADNCVIDKYGRMGARRGFENKTTDPTAYGADTIRSISEHINYLGASTALFTFGANKIYQGEATPANVTPAGHPGITAGNWQHGQVGQYSMWAQEGHEMLIYNEATGAVLEHTNAAFAALTTYPQGNTMLGAYGRSWTYERSATDRKGYLYWSDLLVPYDYDNGSSGSIILDNVWPKGNDDVVAIVAHNKFLIVFGRRQILVFSGADDDPTTNLALTDHVIGIGCVARDTVASTGDDILWFDDTGVRSFNRTIQEKSLPIGDVSANVTSELLSAYSIESEAIKAVYSSALGYYLITFPTSGYVYCFNIKRGPLQNGAYRATRWTALQEIKCFLFDSTDRTLVGGSARVGHYTEYLDFDQTYTFRYYTNPLNFGEPSMMKIPKQFAFTIIGGLSTTFTAQWAYNFTTNWKRKTFTIPASNPAYYNLSEYNSGAEYTDGEPITTPHINVTGRGRHVQVGVEFAVSNPTSIQEVNLHILTGRMI